MSLAEVARMGGRELGAAWRRLRSEEDSQACVAVALGMFIFLTVVSLWKAYLPRPEGVAQILAAARVRRGELCQEYISIVGRLKESLLLLTESCAYGAEEALDEHRRLFEDFLAEAQQHPEKLSDGITSADRPVAAFRSLVSLWFSVFEQVSADPWTKPSVLVKQQELDRCKTLPQIVKLAAETLQGAQARPVRSAVERAEELDLSIPSAKGERDSVPWLGFGDVGFGMKSWGMSLRQEPMPSEPLSLQDDVDDEPGSGGASSSDLQPPRSSPQSPCRRQQQQQPEEPSVVRAAQFPHPAALAPADGGATTSRPSRQLFPLDVCFGAVRVTILSQVHLLFMVTLALGLLVLYLEVAHGKRALITGGILVAEWCIMVLLMNIQDFDEVAHAQCHVQRLEYQVASMHARTAELGELSCRVQPMGKLWQARTVPALDLIAQVIDLLRQSPAKGKVGFFSGAVEKLEKVLAALGPLELWFGERPVHEDMISVVTEQLAACADFLRKRSSDKAVGPMVLSRIGRALGFLVVRVSSASGVQGKLAGIAGAPAPHVEITLGPRECARTEAFDGPMDPMWNEEFFLPVSWDDSRIELFVCSGYTQLGSVQVGFRDVSPGIWHSRTEHLKSLKRKPLPTELSFQYFFASEVPHLADLCGTRAPGAMPLRCSRLPS